MQPIHRGRFEDSETETRFQQVARSLRLPFVRVYGVLFMLVALAYSIVDPLFVSAAENARLAVLLGCVLLVCGSYVAATFWRDYAKLPFIDFSALLGLSLLVGQINLILFAHLIEMHEAMYAVGVINRLSVSAFAAVALAGRQRLFLSWMALDFSSFMVTVLTFQAHDASLWFALLSYASGAAIMVAINIAIDRSSRGAFALADALDAERAKNEELIHNMLPAAAAERIRDGRLVADAYADVSVVFIDMVGFSNLTRRVSPGHLVELLNAFFNHADRCAARHGVEKVKTIGDSYLAIAGGNMASANSADSAIAFARDVLAGIDDMKQALGVEIGLRAGIHSGPVVGGVIGETRIAYDYWGETMNIAARLEATAPVNGIAISDSCWLRASDRAAFGPAQNETLKGVGEICVYRSVPSLAEPQENAISAAA